MRRAVVRFIGVPLPRGAEQGSRSAARGGVLDHPDARSVPTPLRHPQRVKIGARSSARRPSNRARTAGVTPHEVEGEVRVPGHVPVAHEHAHVGRESFRPQRGGREARRHREVDDRAARGGRQDGGLLAARDVDAHDGDVGGPARRLDGLGQPEGRSGVGHDDLVGQAAGAQQAGLALDRHDADAAAGPRPARSGERERPRLPRAAQHRDGGRGPGRDVLPHHPGDEGRGTADVHDHEGQLGREVLGQPGGDGAPEEDGSPLGRHPFGPAVPAGQAVGDPQRGERERDEGRDPVPARSPSGDCGPTSATVPMSMPPDPVTGFCILPRVATMSSTSARTASPSSACFSRSCRKDAASRLRVSTSMRTSSGHSSGEASRRARGLRQRPARRGRSPGGSRRARRAWFAQDLLVRRHATGASTAGT